MKIITFFLAIFSTILIGCSSEDSASNLKKQAEEALKSKDYAKAAEYLEKALLSESENQELHYYLGQAYRLLLFDDGSKINNVNPAIARTASKHFRRAIEISPKYEGRKFVLGPYSKIQGIWGAVAMTYLCEGKTDSAIYAFKKGQLEGGFYPALVEYNKNTMASCDKNAILFTNGDDDTYPMWFLQMVDGYRRDITVVNVNLLNIPWYIKQLKNGYPFGDNNISMYLRDEEVDNLKYMKWHEKVVDLPVNNDPLNKDGKIQWSLKPTINNKAIRVQDIMLLKILKANNWKRPIYFSTTVSKLNKLGLDDYLAFEGLVYRLKSHREKISIEQLENNCFKVYTYNGVHDEHLKYIEELQGLFQNYRSCFVKLATFYSEGGKKDKSRKTLEFMNKKLPEKLLPYTSD